MGTDAIGADDVGGTEPGRAGGAGAIETGHAITRKNYLYKTVNVRFRLRSTVKQPTDDFSGRRKFLVVFMMVLHAGVDGPCYRFTSPE